jgi:hypothetical protein
MNANDFDDVRRTHGDKAVVLAIDGARRPAAVSATPFRWRTPDSVPLRPWVYGRQLLRGTVSVLIAPGATGKTAMLIGTAMALVSGRPILGKTVWDGPKRVWLWNLEDGEEDLARLILACGMHWGIGEDDVGDRLFVDSALNGAELKMAIEGRDGFQIVEPIMDALTAELIARKIDVLIIDPFVSSHSVNENDNGAIDAIAKKWARVAMQANCAIVLSHHTRKLAGVEAGAEAARGAKSLIDAARSAMVLNRMTEDEAQRYGVEGEARRRYFRAYDDKNNRAPPSDVSDWFELASVSLGNGPDGTAGDSIQVASPWTPPDTFDGITVEHLRSVQRAIDAGEWRKDPQSSNWAGHAVADVLELDLKRPAERKRVNRLLKEWLESGVLAIDEHKDAKRVMRPFIVVGRWADDQTAPPLKSSVEHGGAVERTGCSTTTAPLTGAVGGSGARQRPHGGGADTQSSMILADGEEGDDVDL